MLFFRQFLLLTVALCCTQAGIIKKRDTTAQQHHDFTSGNLTEEVQPTILTKVSSGGVGDGFNTSEVGFNTSEVGFNTNEVITTKLQSVAGSTGFSVETQSKELTNNEILINEAKKLLEEEDKIINTNETTMNGNNRKEEKENENDNDKKEADEEEEIEHDNLKDIKEIIKNLENKEQNLSEISESSTEQSSNDIKEGKHEEMKEQKELKEEMEEEETPKTVTKQSEEVVNSFENNLKSNDMLMTTSPAPSRILTELHTEAAVKEISTEKTLLTQEENFIEHKTENQEELFDKKEKSTENQGNLESFTKTNSLHTTQPENPELTHQKQNSIEDSVEKAAVQTTADAQIKVQDVLNTEENLLTHRENFIENIKAKASATESPTKSNNLIKPEEFLNQIQLKDLNNSGNSLSRDHDQMLEGSTSSTSTTTLAPTNDEDLNIFEGNKTQYARSMPMAMAEDKVTTFKPLNTFKPVVLSIKDGIEEHTTGKENLNNSFSVALKEKKPKFINDNSTNAQQLNLPNNAEVWSLAAMKTLPKMNNNSLETAQMQTQTLKEENNEKEQEVEEEKLERTTLSNNNTTPLMSNNNNNSEKNLLDWSQIMMNKELSTTTRNNEHYKQQENVKDFNTNIREMQENTSTTTTLATILSFTNDDNNTVTDKKVEEENMNNYIELLTSTSTTTATPTPTITTVMHIDKHPLNATLPLPLPTETNLSEKNINLTLNENQNTNTSINTSINDDKPIVTTTAAAGNEEEEEASTSTLATTSTEATAVVDMTTAVVEQNSSETTTVSTLETSKLNTTLNNRNPVITQQQQEKQIENNNFHTNNNEIKGEEGEEQESPNNLKNTLQHNPTFKENNEFNLKSITTTTTTAVPIITTFRPNILAITPTTAIDTTINSTATHEQEIDQKGNEIQTNLSENKQLQQQQSIKNNLNDIHNSTKAIETHLEDTKQYESTTTTSTTTTTTTLETIATTTSTPTLIPTSSTELIENTTSSLNSHKTENEEEDFKLYNIETTTTTTTTESIASETTPKAENNNYETTIGSFIHSSTVNESTNEEKESEKELEIETTTAAAILTTKTPVVAIETQSVITELKESSTTESTTDESVIEATTRQTEQESEIKTKENETKDKDVADNENITEKHETSTSTTTSAMTTSTSTVTQDTVKTTEKTQTMATSTEQETFISLLDDTTTTTTTTEATYSSPSNTLTTTPQTILSTTTTTSTSEPLPITTKIAEIYNVIHSTTTEFIQTTTSAHLNAETEEDSSTSSSVSVTTSSTSDMIPSITPPTPTTTPSTPMIATADIGKSLPTLTTTLMGGNSGNMYTKNTEASNETDVNVIIAITVSVIGVVALILLVGFLYIMRKRQKQTSFSRRCQPVSLDEYTIDNVSVGGSMRKSSALRSSKRTYGNLAFDDPSLRHNPMGVHELSKFVQEKLRIFEEFRDVPQITSRLDEVPPGCEDKNRYANVLPLPETRVILQRLNSDDRTEYINANYVTVDKFFKEGPKDPPNYYIACQAPLESTVEDFWRMIWEQQSRVIIQATDLIENGVEKCAEYLPPSVTLDNHSTFGDFQITLQNREVKDKYAISTLLLRHVSENATRELTHYWYKWPEVGVPAEEAPIIAMLLEARSSLISYAIEQANEDKEKSSTATLRSAEEGTVTSLNGSTASPANTNSNGSSSANVSCGEINGNISMVQLKKTARSQGPLTVHCSPGTGRTGTIIACDIAIRSLETPKRTVDIPQIVYYVRRGRASAVLTKEQYEFIYKVANMYAAKISNPTSYH